MKITAIQSDKVFDDIGLLFGDDEFIKLQVI